MTGTYSPLFGSCCKVFVLQRVARRQVNDSSHVVTWLACDIDGRDQECFVLTAIIRSLGDGCSFPTCLVNQDPEQPSTPPVQSPPNKRWVNTIFIQCASFLLQYTSFICYMGLTSSQASLLLLYFNVLRKHSCN